MAQLSNDCFAFGGELMSVAEARRLIMERLEPVAHIETVGLTEADGRVLGQRIIAPIDLPPFRNSAVDGYAVAHAELSPSGAITLPLAGRVAAGASLGARAPAGHAIRIFTGAPMPEGVDTVFMQEDVKLIEGAVSLPQGLKREANTRAAGEDISAGTPALEAGRRLTPRDVALLAGLGISQVPVRRTLRVALFSTGNEIVSPGEPLPGASLYDANRFLLGALLRRLGCAVTDLGILPDQREAVVRALADCAPAHDLILTSGGVSTGEEDHVKAAVESAGALTFWRLGIKPGRPVALGVVAGTPFIGLPGNPVAVFVTFTQVARALIARLSGEIYQPPAPLPVRCGFDYRKKEGRREYVRVRLARGDDGPVAQKHPREGAGVITSLTETDGLVELPEEVTRVVAGETVEFVSYASLL